MSTNPKKLVRKYSLKIYRSPRLLHYPIPEAPQNENMKNEVIIQKKYNSQIIKPEQNQENATINAQQETKLYSNSTNKRNMSTEEKKVIKIPINAKNSIKLNNKGEIDIKSLNRNNSGTKITSTVKESYIQNKYISSNTNINNQPLFYSNIDLSGHNNKKNINTKNINESTYNDRRRKTVDVENKSQRRSISQAKPQIAKAMPQTKKLPQQKNPTINLKQSESQKNIKIISNNSNIKISTNNSSKDTYDRRIPKPPERKIINTNTSKINKAQPNIPKNPSQNTIHVSSNTSRRNSKTYQDRDANRTINTSSNNQRINNGKNVKNNIQTNYTSQTYKRQENSNNNVQKSNVYISGNKNGKEYTIKTKDNKPQANYDKNKKHVIYESRYVNKENYDKNKAGYTYIVNFNDLNRSFNGNKVNEATNNRRRNAVNN